MFWLVVLVSPVVSAIVPVSTPAATIGPNPSVSNRFYGRIPPDFYSRYLPKGYEEQAPKATDYQGDGSAGIRRNYAQDFRDHETRDKGGLATTDDSDGLSARDGTGDEKYHDEAPAAGYNQVGNAAAAAAASKYGVAGLNGYGGQGNGGQQTSGFHKEYHDIKSGKGTNRINKGHDGTHEKYGQAHEDAYGSSGWGVAGRRRGEELHASGAANGAAVERRAGAYDVNDYHHNEDLAHKRGRELAEDLRLVRDGLHGLRTTNGTTYHNELW